MKTAIILVSESSLPLAKTLKAELLSGPRAAEPFPPAAQAPCREEPAAPQRQRASFDDEVIICSKAEIPGCEAIGPYAPFLKEHWQEFGAVVFIGALGICVRSIAPALQNKYTDPAVVCIDSTGKFVIPVVSGHVGGSNDLARRIASIIGGEAVVTTQSDNEGLWALDTLGREFGWQTDATRAQIQKAVIAFVGRRPTALLLEVKDRGTAFLENNLPSHVKCFKNRENLDFSTFELLIAVTPRLLPDLPESVSVLAFRPPVLHLGAGCRKQCNPDGIPEYIESKILEAGFSPKSIASVGTVELKKDEPLMAALCEHWPQAAFSVRPAEELEAVEVPNPSEKAFEATGTHGVAEAAAILDADAGPLLIEKQKCRLSEGNDFTFALAQDAVSLQGGHIEIVGAGPGDPELVSVRGKRFLEEADLILYAGSLVPIELTHYAKPGCVVRSSASLDLEEQFALMKEFYDRGLLVVRLHTGDPCIYGAIQEQMAFFDRYEMSYHITPGISAFQAAAAALRSQFTIPEKVQTIILTRGEGRTPMPEKEQLHKLAQSQSTMCIYLSAAIVEEVQAELLQAYPPETPVAACYKLTWKEERIYRGELSDLAKIVRENNLTLTTLLVVGEAIGNREGFSRLYAHDFKHLFRK